MTQTNLRKLYNFKYVCQFRKKSTSKRHRRISVEQLYDFLVQNNLIGNMPLTGAKRTFVWFLIAGKYAIKLNMCHLYPGNLNTITYCTAVAVSCFVWLSEGLIDVTMKCL